MKPLVRANLVAATGGANPRPLQKSEKAEPIHTDEEIPKLAGVSRDTISKAEKIIQDGTDEQNRPPPPVKAERV